MNDKYALQNVRVHSESHQEETSIAMADHKQLEQHVLYDRHLFLCSVRYLSRPAGGKLGEERVLCCAGCWGCLADAVLHSDLEQLLHNLLLCLVAHLGRHFIAHARVH